MSGTVAGAPEVGYDLPAVVGMSEAEIETPCLVIDLDAFEGNLRQMGEFCAGMGVKLRAHGKMHKSADIARRQIEIGGATGICCQKASEAEAFARGGITDILVTNQVRSPRMIDRLARLAGEVSLGVCVDDLDNVAELSSAAVRHGSEISVLVEIDCGAGRCGVEPGAPAVELARAAEDAAGLRFSGIQAYHGAAQHVRDFADRKARIEAAIDLARKTRDAILAAGLACPTVTGAGTGSYMFEGSSGVYTELQCGSYAFMDADYQKVRDAGGAPISEFRNAFFLLTSIMSTAKPGQAVCDAGLKVQSIDSGLPVIFGRDDIEYVNCSDEHGVIRDPGNTLAASEKLRLVPGHCDPTCNIHDWYVGIRDGKVECLWPVTARGKAY
ncbi:DSD1 family PLP-dependent enzyme [Nisaea sp.]|uniref:DSD1 family PLP-dependent enzyme n=1 Tax=Nisaea sp. TaxID=2024842 RepID=UPI003B51F8EA